MFSKLLPKELLRFFFAELFRGLQKPEVLIVHDYYDLRNTSSHRYCRERTELAIRNPAAGGLRGHEDVLQLLAILRLFLLNHLPGRIGKVG